jgi:hypothetical protein
VVLVAVLKAALVAVLAVVLREDPDRAVVLMVI